MKKIILFVILLLPISIKASESFIVMDADSLRVLGGKNINEELLIASTTKLMTSLVALENSETTDVLCAGEEILSVYGSMIYIDQNECMTLYDLLMGLNLRSGNDAALMIADYVGKDVTDFVNKMNQKAKEIGMKNTTFHNPSGLDEEDEVGNYSTAYDMAILTSYAMKNKEYRTIVGTKKYTLKTNKNHYIWYNKNKLLTNYKYTTGGKTGFTKKARRTLVSTASKDNLNLVVVTLNDGNDFQDHENLHEYGFSNYKEYRLLKKGIVKVKEEKYYQNDVLYIKNNIDYSLRDDEKQSVRLSFQFDKKKQLKNNRKVGEIHVKVGDEIVKKEPLYVKKKNVEKKGFFHFW